MPWVGEQPGVYTIMLDSSGGYEPDDRRRSEWAPAKLGLSAIDMRDETASFSVANMDVLDIGLVKDSRDCRFG